MLPTVFLNSAHWGQADSIYTTFILISLYYLLKKKYLPSFIFLGISFAFKLQFIFILPLYILVYLSERKFSILYFFIIPLMNFILCIPAMLFGRSIESCMSIYFNQVGEYSDNICMNFPNFWCFFGIEKYEKINMLYLNNNNYGIIGIVIALLIFIILAGTVYFKKIKFDNKMIIEFGLLSIMISTFFLPRMHDRYLYVADVLSIVYLLYNKKRRYIPIGISLISLYCYINFLCYTVVFPIKYMGIIYTIIIFMFFKDIYLNYLHKPKIETSKI